MDEAVMVVDWPPAEPPKVAWQSAAVVPNSEQVSVTAAVTSSPYSVACVE
jgi:hypothetical protein